MAPLIRVAAGVLRDARDGKILIARRPELAHAGGYWEFPGGKIRDDETPAEALERELREELGIDVLELEPLTSYRHAYPDRVVELNVWLVPAWRGEPRGLEGQPIMWLPAEELSGAGLLPADLPVVDALLNRG